MKHPAAAGPGPARVLVNGLPGAGKSTLARALAERTGWPCLAKDAFKEILFDQLGAEPPASGGRDGAGPDARRAWSARLGRASMALLYATAELLPAAILDGPFDRCAARAEPASLRGTVVEVYCRCPEDVARRRFAARERHPGHGDRRPGGGDAWEAWRAAYGRPVGVGPVLEVDTSGGVDADAVAVWVRRAVAAGPPPAAPDRR